MTTGVNKSSRSSGSLPSPPTNDPVGGPSVYVYCEFLEWAVFDADFEAGVRKIQ